MIRAAWNENLLIEGIEEGRMWPMSRTGSRVAA